MSAKLKQGGFTYLALLFLVAAFGVALAATGVVWSMLQRREKEQQLLYIGNEYRQAIASYYERTPGTLKRYPGKLSDLIKDNRHLATVRHLRRLYADPLTLKPEWGLVRAPDGGIMGVYSLAPGAPLKRSGFSIADSAFENKKAYSDWRFVYVPGSQ